MVVAFYFLTFMMSLFICISYLIKNRKIDTYFASFSLMVMTNCFGRYLLAVSPNLEMALWANYFLYIGACFCPALLIVILSQLCEIEMPTWLTSTIFTYATIVLCFVFTIGKADIYYKNVHLAYRDGYYYLIKVYGPLHSLFPIYMVVCMLIMLYFVVYAIRKRKRMSRRTVMSIALLSGGTMLLYFLERVTRSQISYISIGYFFAICLMLNLFERIHIYDMTTNIALSVERMGENGYIILDHKFRYVNASVLARKLFPEIERDWQVDKPVPDTNSYLFREVIVWLMQGASHSKTITVDEMFFEVTITEIVYNTNERCAGYLLEIRDRTDENKYINIIEHYNSDLKREVERQVEDISHIKDMMVLGMADMVESRDNSTGGHIKRTSKVVKIFTNRLKIYGKEFGLTDDFVRMIVKAAPMHDLGKISVNDRILCKQGKFTPEEFEEMKKHAAEGARIVGAILRGVENEDFVRVATNVAHYHHEKWNGKGYPTGLSGVEIPIEARIMALADVFDALVSRRCYKDAYSYDKAFEVIEQSLGGQFDPRLGKIFLECRPALELLYETENEENL